MGVLSNCGSCVSIELASFTLLAPVINLSVNPDIDVMAGTQLNIPADAVMTVDLTCNDVTPACCADLGVPGTAAVTTGTLFVNMVTGSNIDQASFSGVLQINGTTLSESCPF